ncbi:MAG: hypothetical protein HC834_03275 [Rhodospirillales bacterium]|nr:hypothetical protein [Rhodospirillales bacterium]
MATQMVRHGPVRYMRDGILPFTRGLKEIKLSAREAQLAGTANDLTVHGRTGLILGIMDDLRMGTKFERGIQFLANRIGFVQGMDHWNQWQKSLSANISIARTSQALESMAAGKASKSDIFHLNRVGLDENSARLVWKYMLKGSEDVNGVRYPNTETWGRDAIDEVEFDEAMQAKRAFRAALARDVDDTIVTPGTELPTVATQSELGRVIFQLRSFTFSSTMKVLVAGLQASRVHGRASGSIMALSTVPFFLASGMLSYYLWAAATGGRAWEEMQNADEEKWITEGILRGLPLGLFGEVPRFG